MEDIKAKIQAMKERIYAARAKASTKVEEEDEDEEEDDDDKIVYPAGPNPFAAPPVGMSGENASTEESNLTTTLAEVNVVEEKEECLELYDPCTREPIESVSALEKRLFQIKKLKKKCATGLYGLTAETTIYDFIKNVFVNSDISLDEMVSFCLAENRNSGSDIFEVLCRIFVFLGGIQNVNPREDGNFNFVTKIESSELKYPSALSALTHMKCIATRKEGISDISLIRNKEGTSKSACQSSGVNPYCEVPCEKMEGEEKKLYIMSVKWLKKESGAEKRYDIESLKVLADKLRKELHPVGIIVFLKSKLDFQLAHIRSFRKFVKEIPETFFGWEEEIKPFLESKRRSIFEYAKIKELSPFQAFEEQYLQRNSKPILSLQLHQDIIVKGLCNRIDVSDDNLFLVGVLPRGGKTFIAGGIIREYIKRKKIEELNVFWITAAPNETITQVKDDLVNCFQDFDDFKFIHARDDISEIKQEKRNKLIFCSSQLLIKAASSTKREYLRKLLIGEDKLGLIFFDEAHKTGAGKETKDKITKLIASYENYRLPFIFMTATYYNVLVEYEIQKENTFIWDYTDVLKTRGLASESDKEDALINLKEHFGEELVSSIITERESYGETLETMANSYLGFPDLYFISSDFNEEAKRRFEEQDVYRPQSGFSLNSIFAIKPAATINDIKTEDNKIREDAWKIFENTQNPRNIIGIITKEEQFQDEDEGGQPLVKEEGSYIEPSILGRIDQLSRDTNSRFRLDEKPTLLMFMPTGGAGSNIYFLLCAWASLLMKHPYWKKNYEVACVIDEKTMSEEDIESQIGKYLKSSDTIHIINKDLKASLLQLERDLHCSSKKGLIILAGDKLSMGISLPCTDVVFLFNEKKSPDDIIQKMYRALTPSREKKSAFIVDLNPVRTFAAVYGYTRASNKKINKKSEIIDILYDTYTWDDDYFQYNVSKGTSAAPLTFQKKLDELYEKASKDVNYGIEKSLFSYKKDVIKSVKKALENPALLGKIISIFSSKRDSTGRLMFKLSKDSTVVLDKGRLVIRKTTSSEEGSASNEENEDILDELVIIENFAEAVDDFIKYLSLTTTKETLPEAIDEFKNSKLNTNGSSFQQNVLKYIKSGTNIKHTTDDDLMNILADTVKSILHSSEMEFRQLKGRVDEPSIRKDAVLDIIHKHLQPKEKQKKDFGEVFTPIECVTEMLGHIPKKGIWDNPEAKFLDPAGGIGNFPIVAFYKLDEGLKTWKSDETERRKHIIENMIYMIELQSNNTRIAKRLFEKLCEGCKPNILTTDSISITDAELKSKKFPDFFDVVMGNPPYQPAQLWEKFIVKYFKKVKENGYFTFIVPTAWSSPTSNSWKLLSEKQIIVINNSEYLKKEYFPSVSSTFSYFLVKNSSAHKETKIIMDKKSSYQINISDYPILPIVISPITLSIGKKVLKNTLPGKFDRKDRGNFHSSRNAEHTYPYILFKKTDGSLDIRYHKEKDPRQTKKKVLLFRNGYINPIYDNGENGVGDNIHALEVESKEEGENIVKLFTSKLYKYIWNIYKHSAYNAGTLMNSVFRDVSEIKHFDDESIYSFFKLTQAEIKFVELYKVKASREGTTKKTKTKGGARFNKTRKNKK